MLQSAPTKSSPRVFHHSMLSREHARRMLETVERELLTPFGLRSLVAQVILNIARDTRAIP